VLLKILKLVVIPHRVLGAVTKMWAIIKYGIPSKEIRNRVAGKNI
jgi:hypothetical protein